MSDNQLKKFLKEITIVIDKKFDERFTAQETKFALRFKTIENKLDWAIDSITKLYLDTKEIKTDIKDMKTDIKDMKTDIKDLKHSLDITDLATSLQASNHESRIKKLELALN